MAYTLQQFRDLVRLTMDLDADDLADLLVDEWVRDGAVRAQSKRQRWPFFEKTWTFSTVEGQSTYTVDAITADSGEAESIAEIRQVRGPRWDLKWVDISSIDQMSPQNSVRTGSPTHYARWGNGDLVLSPEPTVIETFQIRGFQEPTDWVAGGAGNTSDMPDTFDSPILNWAIGRAYAQQDEPQTALYYADMSDLRLDELVKRYNDTPPAIDVTMGGERRMSPLTDPRFPWE